MNDSSIIRKTFIKLLPLQIIMVAIGSINSVIDGAVTTNLLNPLALSACGLFFPVIKLLDTVNAAMLGGTQILCSKYIGRNQVERSEGIFSLDIVATLVFGFLMSAICFFCGPLVSGLLVQDASLAQMLCEYMRGYAPGIIAYLLVGHLAAFLQLENQEKRTYIGMAMMIVVNIVMDIVFVSSLKLGLFGLGLATTISNYVYVIILASYYITHEASVKLRLSSVNIKDMVEILQTGLPGAATQFAQVIRSIVLNMLMLRYIGGMAVAAFSAVYAFGSLYYAVTAGVANATRVLCSIYAGEEDRNALKEVMELSVKMGTALVSAIMVVLMILAVPFTNMFYSPEAGDVFEMTKMGFLLFPLTTPLSCITCTYLNYYQCRNRLGIANALSLIDGVIGVVLFSAILAPGYLMTGVWAAHIFNGLLCVLTIWIYTLMGLRRIPVSIEDTLLLPDSFGVTEENRMDVYIDSMDEVLELSKNVMAFCNRHNVEHRRSMYAGLSIEEMVGNIVSYGFADGKLHLIDVRVVYKSDGLLLRIKDDCRMFNPRSMLEVLNPSDVTRNIGIRMVSKIARKFDYINSYGLNILTIEI